MDSLPSEISSIDKIRINDTNPGTAPSHNIGLYLQQYKL